MKYRTIDIESYLSSVEERIRSTQGPTSHVTLTEQHRKTMIQTLLQYPGKIEFDKAIRDTKNQLEHLKMANFVTDVLNPTIRPTENERIRSKAPNYMQGMEFALGCDPSTKGVPRRFSRMASGRAYRGNLTDMLADVAPELMSQYNEARKPLSEEEVLMSLITSSSSVCEQFKDAAMTCLTMELSSGNSYVGGGGNGAQQRVGANCEKQCIEYLKHKNKKKEFGTNNNNTTNLVFENVYVLKTSAPGRLNGSDHKTQWEKDPESAVITTITDRDGITSEFDGVVVKLSSSSDQNDENKGEMNGYVTEIWESKTTLNPSTIMDAILKKLSSARSLIEEDSSLLVYRDGGCASMTPEHTKQFGIFGTELLNVDKAVSQMKVIACQEALKDVRVVLEALESGMICVSSKAVIDKLVTLRDILRSMNDFSLVLVLADDSDEALVVVVVA